MSFGFPSCKRTGKKGNESKNKNVKEKKKDLHGKIIYIPFIQYALFTFPQ